MLEERRIELQQGTKSYGETASKWGGDRKKTSEKGRTKVTQRKQRCCGVPSSSCLTCSCSTVGKKEHVLCLSHCISLWHDDLECPGTCPVVVAVLQAQEILEKYLVGSWGRSLHHSGEVHSSRVGVLIRRHCDDKHDTKIQAFAIVISLAVICYNMVIKDE